VNVAANRFQEAIGERVPRVQNDIAKCRRLTNGTPKHVGRGLNVLRRIRERERSDVFEGQLQNVRPCITSSKQERQCSVSATCTNVPQGRTSVSDGSTQQVSVHVQQGLLGMKWCLVVSFQRCSKTAEHILWKCIIDSPR